MEKVSLYIPCYNAENSIKECLDSIINQSYAIDEIIIIDDGSNDRTVDIANAYPVRIIRHKENRGLAACRNTALKEAKNDFVASLDADCVAKPQWLKLLMQCFINDDIAGSAGMLIERYNLNAADRWRSIHMPQHWGVESIENPPFLYGNNTVFKKKAIAKSGFYNERLRINYEDVDLALRVYACGFRLIYNPKACVEHIKKDTIRSAIFTYRNWLYYKQISLLHIDRFSCRIAMHFGMIAEYAENSEIFFRKDLRGKNYKLLPIDILFIVYCIWLDLKQSFRTIHPLEGKI
jgi:glycosyltransferase involved in cell wall biosynthesis